MFLPAERHATHERSAILRLPGVGGLRLLHATRGDSTPGVAQRAEHQHELYHAVAYASGTGTCLVDGVVVSVAAPFLVLISPGQPHSFTRCPGETAVYHEVTFAVARPGSAPTWSGLLSRYTGESCTVPAWGPCSEACVADLGACAARIGAAIADDLPHTAALLQGALAELLLSLFRHLVAERERSAPPDPLDQARRFIEAHADDAIDLGAVARIAGMSSKHLGRVFARRFGMPPMHYRRHILMQRAAVLLRSTGDPVEVIAERLGFADWRYFSRCFRAAHGRPPAVYRRGA
jgi:AraC-like DNA-binding protein